MLLWHAREQCEIGGSYSELDEVWDITPCRQVKLPMFRRSLLSPPAGSRNPRRDTVFVRNVGKCLCQLTERNLPTRRQTLERKYFCCKRVCVGCRLKVATGTWNTVYLKNAVTWVRYISTGLRAFLSVHPLSGPLLNSLQINIALAPSC
jgi:hypothetical protein